MQPVGKSEQVVPSIHVRLIAAVLWGFGGWLAKPKEPCINSGRLIPFPKSTAVIHFHACWQVM